MPRLHEVRTVRVDGLRGWLALGQYQMHTPPTASGFVVDYADEILACSAFASGVSRFAVASAESVATITAAARAPSSRAWQLIQWYYAAYFAAHATLRMFGLSLTQLERGHARDVDEVAQVFGHPAGSITSGYHFVRALAGNRLQFERLTGSRGVHFELWRAYAQWLQRQEGDALITTTVSARDRQDVAAQLGRLRSVLSSAPQTDGSWLAGVRNDVTYRQGRSVWYPWRPPHGLPSLTEVDPQKVADASLEMARLGGARTDLQRFRYACRVVVALCRALCQEMGLRCPYGTSFQEVGLLALDATVAEGQRTTN
jgi:hypothetical protein